MLATQQPDLPGHQITGENELFLKKKVLFPGKKWVGTIRVFNNNFY